MNFEQKHNNSTRPPFNPEIFLRDFYKKLYLKEKHDSPDESRTSMVRRIKKLITEGKIFPNKVLNIGSGPQALEKQLLNRSQGGGSLRNNEIKFTSIDLAQIMANKLLSGKTKNVSHVQGNVVNLPFQDKTFGLVVSNHAIDFCPQEEAFREASRVLNDNGKGIFYFHHPLMLRELSKNEEIRTFWQHLRDNSILFFSEEEIKTFLEKVGFVPLEISLKSDKYQDDTWWEVVAEKRNNS